MANQEDFIVDTREETLYTELSASPERVSISIDADDAGVLSNTVTKTGRKAFLEGVFDALDVPVHDEWVPAADFKAKHSAVTDEESLRFRRRYEDAYHELAARGSQRVVAKFTQECVSVELRQAAPDELDVEDHAELTEWEQTVIGETYEWVDGVFDVTGVTSDVIEQEDRKVSLRVFLLTYRDGTTDTMPVSVHKRHTENGHISALD